MGMEIRRYEIIDGKLVTYPPLENNNNALILSGPTVISSQNRIHFMVSKLGAEGSMMGGIFAASEAEALENLRIFGNNFEFALFPVVRDGCKWVGK